MMTAVANPLPTISASLITEAHRKQFEADGVVPVRGLITSYWLNLMAEAAEEFRAEMELKASVPEELRDKSVPLMDGFLFNSEAWMSSEKVRAFIFESGLSEVAASILRSREIRLYEDILVYKRAGSTIPTDFHQDEPQMGTQGRQTCNIWFSLEPVTEAEGSLRVVRGSHLGPRYTPGMPPGREADAEEFEGGEMPDFDAHPDRFQIVSYDMAPGDALIFHPLAAHGAYGSPLSRPRRSFAVRFVGDDIRWIHRRCAYHVWVRDLPLATGDRLIHERFPLLRG